MKKIIALVFFIMASKFYCQVSIPVTDSCVCGSRTSFIDEAKEIELNFPIYGQGVSRSIQGAILFTSEAEFRNYYKRYFRQSMIDSALMMNNVKFNTSNMILFWKWFDFGYAPSSTFIQKCSANFLQLNIVFPSDEFLAINAPTIKYIVIPKKINQIKQIKICPSTQVLDGK